MTCDYIDSHKESFGVEPICTALCEAGVKIAPSTYYARKKRTPSKRATRDAGLSREIKKVHESNYEVFGVRKMHAVLNRPTTTHPLTHIARCTVERLMRAEGLHGIRRAKAPNTTRSAPRESCPADLVKRHFEAFAPNELWVADVTYVRTYAGWVYVSFITDVFNREIVGWQASTSLYTDLALDALNMAIYQQKRAGADLSGLIHHSDRGVQYRSIRYGQALAAEEAVASVGPTGDSYDNALAEALNSLYKAELIRNKGPWRDIDDVEIATAEWVHWFNHDRPHSALDYATPLEWKTLYPNGIPHPTTDSQEPQSVTK